MSFPSLTPTQPSWLMSRTTQLAACNTCHVKLGIHLHVKSIYKVKKVTYANKCIVIIMKVYIEKKNMQLELIRSSSSVAVSVAGVVDHDLPLFAISCIHKHLRSAATKCLLYSRLLLRSDVFNATSPPKVYPEVSNTNHFGSVSDSLGRLTAAIQCVASYTNARVCFVGFCTTSREHLPWFRPSDGSRQSLREAHQRHL